MSIHERKRQYFLVITFLGILLLIITGIKEYRQRRLPPRIREYKKFSRFRLPAEFEKQRAIWLQWPSEVYNLKHPVVANMVDIIKALAPYIKVNLMVRSNPEIAAVKNIFQAKGFPGENVVYYVINHFSIWARDVGPLFLKDNYGRLQVADFGFNNYGRQGDPHYLTIEGQVDSRVAGLLGLPVLRTNLISEGGAIESNGRGALMITESVALERNPGLGKAQIEKEYQRVLGVTKIIWLKKGLAEDDRITTGHINEIARFAAPDTILLAEVLPRDRFANRYSRESFLRLEENFRILKSSTDQDGNPFRIIRIPMPPALYGESEPGGGVPVRSYLNYVVANGVVLLPVYWNPGRPAILRTTESNVMARFRQVFPGRNVIGIDTVNINLWGGGIHCVTQDMP